ncbi:hypothetical protein HPB48_006894 [Haemaphysalis longicornis]|uniref:Uncharacterized protein n=1 Tax=Haemaphysalis longicornis TaxID=44386 RepID=A0A9J6FHG6_HAELO|nr:hypothetical protein HPB48_006894 [Haemaphysalis longicornis]
MGEILALLAESQRQREQFSTDGVNADAVEMAVWMIKERRGDQVRPSRKVEDAINRYQQAQSAIIACRDEVKEQDKLQALMDARDAACENLLQELQTFQDSPDTAGSVNGLEHLQTEDFSESPAVASCSASGVSEPSSGSSSANQDRIDTVYYTAGESAERAKHAADVKKCLASQSATERKFKLLDREPASESSESGTEFVIVNLDAEKIPEYQKMRRPTDAARTRLTACLQDLVKALDSGKLKAGSEESPFTSLEESGANAGSLASLEMSARQLLASVRAEISACHMLSSPDGRVLAMLVPQAARELQRLIEEASKVSTVHDCYRGLLRDIAQDGPECTSSYADRLAKEVLQLRSAARKLKSAVRHRLADLEDIEVQLGCVECALSALGCMSCFQSCDEDEVAQVQSDVNALRAKLHGILVEEEKLMDKLADLQHRRFPELAVMHPSLELAQYKDQRQASLMVPGKGLPLAGGTHAVLPRWHVLLQVLEALRHLHSAAGGQPALVHGRVHPASVMVSEDGHSAWLSLPDFNTYSLEHCNRKELPLIRSLVAKDPRERPTAAGLLAHPIFQWCVEVQPPLKAKQAEPDSSEKMAKQAAALEEPAASEAAPEAAAEGPSASEATAEGPSAPEAAAEGPSASEAAAEGPSASEAAAKEPPAAPESV